MIGGVKMSFLWGLMNKLHSVKGQLEPLCSVGLSWRHVKHTSVGTVTEHETVNLSEKCRASFAKSSI